MLVKRIGVAFPGDPSRRATWSGTPAGVMRGLAAAGAEPVAIRAEPRPLVRALGANLIAAGYLRPRRDVKVALRRSRAAALALPGLAVLNSRAVPRRVRRAGPLDGIVQIGTGYTLPDDVLVATFEDMTVAQTRSQAYAGWDLLSTRAFHARVARQRRAYDQAVRLLPHEPLGRRVGDPRLRHLAGEGPRGGPGPQSRRPRRGGATGSAPRFLFVGMDWERKNGVGVLPCLRPPARELPRARLDLVGGHPRGRATRCRRTRSVERRRGRSQRAARAALRPGHLLRSPSHSEASAIAYVEAAAAGLPSIGTVAGGSDYLIGDGGLVVDPGDDDALLDAMLWLADPAVAARKGAAARRRSERFTWEAVGRRLLRALGGAPPESM